TRLEDHSSAKEPARHDHCRKIDRRSSHGVGAWWNCPTSRAGVQEMLMAGKTDGTQAPPQKQVAETTDTPPLLDLSDAAVKELISAAQKRGYVTHDQVKSLADEVNSEQIEDVLATFSEMGVNVVETEETAE